MRRPGGGRYSDCGRDATRRTSHAIHAGEPFAEFVAHVLTGRRRRWTERPERRRPRLVVLLVLVVMVLVVLVLMVSAVPVVSAARDAHAADGAPEPIPATGARPPPAAQAPGQHQRQHRAHGQHGRQHHVINGLRFHRTCQTARQISFQFGQFYCGYVYLFFLLLYMTVLPSFRVFTRIRSDIT